jgi:hypothetical protein
MPFPNYCGRKRLWTRENVLAGLVRAAGVIQEQLPCCDADYSRLKKGRLDWPTSHRVLEYFGSMARAWIAAGAIAGRSFQERVTLSNIDWTGDEEEILLEYAGIKTLQEIGKELGRSYGAVRKRLQEKGITARANQGFLSASELARLIDCSYDRILRFCRSGRIPAEYSHKFHRWEIDLAGIKPDVKFLLLAERRTHKTWPIDHGDYYRRYGLHRTISNGKTKVVSI